MRCIVIYGIDKYCSNKAVTWRVYRRLNNQKELFKEISSGFGVNRLVHQEKIPHTGDTDSLGL